MVEPVSCTVDDRKPVNLAFLIAADRLDYLVRIDEKGVVHMPGFSSLEHGCGIDIRFDVTEIVF